MSLAEWSFRKNKLLHVRERHLTTTEMRHNEL